MTKDEEGEVLALVCVPYARLAASIYGAEHNLRMVKVQQKIASTFGSKVGLTAFCRIHSALSTLLASYHTGGHLQRKRTRGRFSGHPADLMWKHKEENSILQTQRTPETELVVQAGERLVFENAQRQSLVTARRLLLQAVYAVARQKNCYLAAQFRRIAALRGTNRAAIAVAHSILVIIYHLLSEGISYEEQGETVLEERDRQATEKRLVRQPERLGHQVTLQPMVQAG